MRAWLWVPQRSSVPDATRMCTPYTTKSWHQRSRFGSSSSFRGDGHGADETGFALPPSSTSPLLVSNRRSHRKGRSHGGPIIKSTTAVSWRARRSHHRKVDHRRLMAQMRRRLPPPATTTSRLRLPLRLPTLAAAPSSSSTRRAGQPRTRGRPSLPVGANDITENGKEQRDKYKAHYTQQ